MNKIASVHLRADRMDIFWRTRPVRTQTLYLDPAEVPEIQMARARRQLTALGFSLGADGWRKPLSPDTGLIATAALTGRPKK